MTAGAPLLAGLAEQSLDLFHYTLPQGGQDITSISIMAGLYALEGLAYITGSIIRNMKMHPSKSE